MARWASRAVTRQATSCNQPSGTDMLQPNGTASMTVAASKDVGAPVTSKLDKFEVCAKQPAQASAAGMHGVTGGSKMERWAARAGAGAAAAADATGPAQSATQVPVSCAVEDDSVSPPASTGVGSQPAGASAEGHTRGAQGGSKLARWAARAAGATPAASAAAHCESATTSPASPPPTAAVSAAPGAAGSNKASRWLARAGVVPAAESGGGQHTPAVSPGAPATRPQAGAVALDDPAEVARRGLTQGFRDGCMRPPEGALAPSAVAGSAMEAWLQRAAAKQLHTAWLEKRSDLLDAEKLLKDGCMQASLDRMRRHINPPDTARTFSSVLDDKEYGRVGRGFARSRLDSLQAWVPAENKEGEWMVIDMGRVMTICGIVTQGHCMGPQQTADNPYVQGMVTSYKSTPSCYCLNPKL